MSFFTVRATLVDGKRDETCWRFNDRILAEEKFEEVCGPLCTEAWLISWTDHPSVRGKKEVHLQRHWTALGGTDSTATLLGEVSVLDDDVAQSELDKSEPRTPVTSHQEVVTSELPEMTGRAKQLDKLPDIESAFESLFDEPPDDSDIYQEETVRIAEAGPSSGQVFETQIQIDPKDAKLQVDGQGVAPGKVSLSTGPHTLDVTKDGYSPGQVRIVVYPDVHPKVKIKLKKLKR